MSFDIPEWLIKQYHDTVYTMMQQRGSKLAGLVMRDEQHAKTSYYDRIHPTEPVKLTARHERTPHVDSQHSRVQLTTGVWAWSDMIDDEDRARILAEPQGHYVQAAVMALGRQMDRVIIEAFNATMHTGEEGQTPVTFPSTQVISHNSKNMSVSKLRQGMLKLRQADADPDMQDVVVVLSAEAWDSLLGDPHFINSDFVGTHPLAGGLRTDSPVLGINFVQTQLLPKDSNIRSCFMYLRRSMLLADLLPMVVKVSEMPDYNYSDQVYVRWGGGAVRLEDEAVVQIDIDESVDFDG